MDEIILRIDNVSKQYKLGQIGGTTLRDELQRMSAKWRGKEDPTRKIGAKNYNQGETFMALNGVSFDVLKGERVGIIGHNGAGKSTLLKLISRVTAPTDGFIGLNGRVASMLEVGTGFHPELTGRENVYMNGAILGMTKAEIDRKIEDIIDFSEVRQFIDTPVKRYSSGMYVKLAFSVAAHLDSEIMIMDEVLAVGDVNFQQKCLEKMRLAAEDEGKTILYVSHNMNTIKQLCDRCIVLKAGKIIYDGDVKTAISIYAGENDLVLQKTYDVRDMRRKPGIADLIRIHTITVKSNEIYQSEKLEFSLEIYGHKAIETALFRIVLFDAVGTPVATGYSEQFTTVKGINHVSCSISTDHISPDSYYADIILIEYVNGRQIRHDLVTKQLAFKVQELGYYYNMKWRTDAWGHVVLDRIHVERRDGDGKDKTIC